MPELPGGAGPAAHTQAADRVAARDPAAADPVAARDPAAADPAAARVQAAGDPATPPGPGAPDLAATPDLAAGDPATPPDLAATPDPATPPGPASHGHAATSGPAVVLVGPPGAGKTSVATVLGRLTGLSVRDTDTDVEAMAGRSVADIFTDVGEPEFRRLERAAVTAALAEHTGILALGGGAVMDPATRALLRGHRVAFLAVSMPVGVRRTGLTAARPLLTGINPRATFKAMLDARTPVYQEVATLQVDTDGLTVEQVAQVIIAELGL